MHKVAISFIVLFVLFLLFTPSFVSGRCCEESQYTCLDFRVPNYQKVICEIMGALFV